MELNRKIVDVMYYFMPNGYQRSAPIPNYYELLRTAYQELGFDTAVLEKAREFSEKNP